MIPLSFVRQPPESVSEIVHSAPCGADRPMPFFCVTAADGGFSGIVMLGSVVCGHGAPGVAGLALSAYFQVLFWPFSRTIIVFGAAAVSMPPLRMFQPRAFA